MVVAAVAPGVVLTAEEGLLPTPVLAPQSRPGRGPVHPTPGAALTPTHDPGPGAGPDRPEAALAPGPDHDHVHLPGDAAALNPGAPLLPPLLGWEPHPPN